MKREISYKWIFNIFLLRIFESVNFCSRVSRSVLKRYLWKTRMLFEYLFLFLFESYQMHSQLKRFSWSFFAAESSHCICIYQLSVYTKFISKNYFCFNPVDFRQLYICIIAFLLSNLSQGKLPISYFLLSEAHYEPCFTF